MRPRALPPGWAAGRDRVRLPVSRTCPPVQRSRRVRRSTRPSVLRPRPCPHPLVRRHSGPPAARPEGAALRQFAARGQRAALSGRCTPPSLRSRKDFPGIRHRGSRPPVGSVTHCQAVPMLLTLSTTHEPATDLGYLLHKNPERVLTRPHGRAQRLRQRQRGAGLPRRAVPRRRPGRRRRQERRVGRRADLRRPRRRPASRRTGHRVRRPVGHIPDDPDLNARILGEQWGAYDNMPDWEVNEGPAPRDWGVPRFCVQAGLHNPEIVLARFDYAYDRAAAEGAEALVDWVEALIAGEPPRRRPLRPVRDGMTGPRFGRGCARPAVRLEPVEVIPAPASGRPARTSVTALRRAARRPVPAPVSEVLRAPRALPPGTVPAGRHQRRSGGG